MKQNKFLGVLTIAMSLVLAACGGSSSGGKSGGSSASESESTCKHSYKWVEIVAPKCEEKGSEHQVCSKCGAEKPDSTREKAALGHDWEENVLTQPTCTTKGVENRTCKRAGCGKSEQGVEIDALGHQFSTNEADLVVDTQPQVGQKGSGHYVCTREGCPGENGHQPAWSEAVEIAALVPTVNASKISLVKDGENVMLKIEGTTKYFQKTDTFNWAFGLFSDSTYLAGKAAPETADYAVAGNLKDHVLAANEEADETVLDFDVSFNLTAIAKPAEGAKAGRWQIKAGPDATNYDKGISVSLSNTDGGNTADEAYNYYWRNDQETDNRLNICIDELAPFHFQSAKATFVKGTPAEGETPAVADKLTVKVGGKARRNDLTKAELDAKDPFVQFQTRSGSSYYGPEGHIRSNATAVEGMTYEFSVETVGEELYAYIIVDISFMIERGADTYNTHFNILKNEQQNCVMETDFEELPVEISDTLELIVFSHPKGPNNSDNSYGNLGFKVQEIPTVSAAPAAGTYRGMALGADNKTYVPINFAIAEGDTFAVSNLEVNGAAVTVTSAEFVAKGGYINVVTSNPAYGTLKFMYRDSELKLVDLSGAAAAQLNLAYRGQFYNGCQFVDLGEMTIDQANAMFVRRYDRGEGAGWEINKPSDNRMSMVTVAERKGLQVNGFSSGKVGFTMKEDFKDDKGELAPIDGSKIKSIGCWIYSTAEFDMSVFAYTSANRGSNGQLNTFKIKTGWNYYQTGVVNGSSFKSTDKFYNFQFYYNKVSVNPVFDDLCIYM